VETRVYWYHIPIPDYSSDYSRTLQVVVPGSCPAGSPPNPSWLWMWVNETADGKKCTSEPKYITLLHMNFSGGDVKKKVCTQKPATCIACSCRIYTTVIRMTPMTLLGCYGQNGTRMGIYCHRTHGDFLHFIKRYHVSYPMT